MSKVDLRSSLERRIRTVFTGPKSDSFNFRGGELPFSFSPRDTSCASSAEGSSP
uniref:Uncharacterized protein n=1 Tax=Rhizophora mucronata TaxID=61149 RepID=A0A2P2PT69_RHIMU